MEASLAATGMLEVLATSAVLFMMLSVFPSTSIVSCGSQPTVSHSEHGSNKLQLDVVSTINAHLGEVPQYF